MSPLPLNNLGRHPASWPKLQTAQGGRQGPQCYILIRLANPNHSYQDCSYRRATKQSYIPYWDAHKFPCCLYHLLKIYFCNKDTFKMLNSHSCSLPCTTYNKVIMLMVFTCKYDKELNAIKIEISTTVHYSSQISDDL